MNTRMRYYFVLILSIFIVLMLVHTTLADDTVVLEYYYSESCGSCKEKTLIVDEIEQNYTSRITVVRKEVGSNNTNWQEWKDHGFSLYPSVVINNETKIPKNNITKENLEAILNSYIAEIEANKTDSNMIELPFFGRISESFLAIILLLVTVLVLGLLSVIAFRRHKEK